MKKLIILALMLFATLPFVNLRADILTIEYPLTYTHGYWYDLYDGNFEANPNYSITNRVKILKGSVILDDLTSFHHLLYFDKNNNMIGYMNTALTDIETPLFIDNISTFTPDIPTNAVYFALMGFYPYLNSTPIPEINNFTLGQVFGGSYDLDDTFNVLSSTSFLDLPIAELNNHTLREVFVGALVDNTDWIANNSTNNIVDGFLINIGDGTNATPYISKIVAGLNTNNIYLVSKLRVYNNKTLLIFLRTNDGINSFTLNTPIQNQYYTISLDRYFTTNTIRIDHRYIDSTTANGKALEVDFVYAVNKTSLGISSLTVSQMDYWFSVYQSIKTGTTQFPTGYVNSGTGYVFYSNTTTNLLLTVYGFIPSNIVDYPMYSPIYGAVFDELSGSEQSNQLSVWSNNTWQLLDFVNLEWQPTQTELVDYYTLFQNNIIFDDYYFDDVELLLTQPIVSYSYDLVEDNRGIVDYVNDLMDDIGIGNAMAKFSISLIMIVIVMVILYLVKAPSLVVIMGGLLMLILFIVFGWIPVYIIVIVSAVLFYLIATKGGKEDA